MNDRRLVFGAVAPPGRAAVRAVSFAVRALVSRTQQYSDLVGHEAGLHRSDMAAMNHISQAAIHGEVLGPSDVAKRMSLSPAAVTALVDRLEAVGHLVRHRDEEDRRRVRLDLTHEAILTAGLMFRPMTSAMNEAMESYTDEELELVLRVLRDLTAAVDRADAKRLTLTPHETP